MRFTEVVEVTKKLHGVVDVMGWEYVSEKIAKQLKVDPSYAEILVKQMPTYVDGYFGEGDRFQREFGFELVSLLFPYKPEGYIETMKVVLRITQTEEKYYWLWDKYEEELVWVVKELGLDIDDYL